MELTDLKQEEDSNENTMTSTAVDLSLGVGHGRTSRINRPRHSTSAGNSIHSNSQYNSHFSNYNMDPDEEEAIVKHLEETAISTFSYISLNDSDMEYISTGDNPDKWKRDLYLLIEDPSSSKLAFRLNLYFACSILFSALLTMVETIPSIRQLQWSLWFYLEVLTIISFTIEFILRSCAHSFTFTTLKKFFLSPLTFLDLVAVLPFYVILLLNSDTSVEFRFTILRVFRLFRLFRTYKYSNLLQLSIEVMLIAVRKSLDALAALFFFMLITIILFSTFLYFAERGTWDVEKNKFVNLQGLPSEFDSIPASFWFVIVTITTTGYGDIVPSTLIGKFIAFPLMMLGILLIALPSVIIGRNFTLVWDVLKRRRDNKNSNLNKFPDSSLGHSHVMNNSRNSLSDLVENIESQSGFHDHFTSSVNESDKDIKIQLQINNIEKEQAIINDKLDLILQLVQNKVKEK